MHLAKHSPQHGIDASVKEPFRILRSCQAFLFWCAGANPDYLADCPRTEQVKAESIGAIICCTAIGAFASMFMAVSIAFSKISYLPHLVAPVWAVFIFVLDRFVVSTMLPHSGLVPKIVQTSLRMLLAILIALVIARPLEIKIFEPEIEKRLEDLRQELQGQAVATVELEYRGTFARIEADRERRLTPLRAQIDERRAGLARLLDNLDEARGRAADLEDQKLAEADGSAGSGRRGAGRLFEIKNLAHLASLNKVEQLEAEVDDLEREIVALEVRRDRVAEDLERQREEEELARANAVEQAKNNLEGDSVFGFLDHNRALSQLADTDESVAAAIWAITLLLMMVEVAPVLVKAISPLGPYDYRLAAEYTVSKETIECETRTKSEVRRAFLGKYAEVAKAVFDIALNHRLDEFRRRVDAFDPETDSDVTRLLASISRYIGGRESVVIIPELEPPFHSLTMPAQPEIEPGPGSRPPADAPGNRFSRALFLCAPVPCFFSLLVVAVMTGSLETGIGAASLLLTMWTSYFGIPRASAPQPELSE